MPSRFFNSSKFHANRSNSSKKGLRFSTRLTFENLEERQLLAITWVNQGTSVNDSDSFNVRYAANAGKTKGSELVSNSSDPVVLLVDPYCCSFGIGEVMLMFANTEAVSIRAYRRIFLSFLMFICACAPAAPSTASPLTLEFHTTVESAADFALGPIETNSPLPFPISVGDPISVTLTYEPGSGMGTYVQSGQLEIRVRNQQLLTSPFQITVANDANGIIDTRGRVAVAFAPSVDRGQFDADRVVISCTGGLGSYCGVVPDHSEFKFLSQLVFEDDVDLSTLSTSELFSDIAVWNSFRNREMHVAFNNGAFFGAYIPSVSMVPEPSVASLALSALICYAVVKGSRHYRVTLLPS
jgi:hypothetical protein